MIKVILISIVGLFSCLSACQNTEKVKIYLEYKIDRVLDEEVLETEKLEALMDCWEFVDYLEYIDGLSLWDR